MWKMLYHGLVTGLVDKQTNAWLYVICNTIFKVDLHYGLLHRNVNRQSGFKFKL